MQSEFHFQSRNIQEPNEFFSLKKLQLALTILSLAVAFFAILELSLS
ncbi:MAG: hypothetical protein K9L85_03955 [Candidatus Peribacteraceae bacterium]|nr:hypothetical protein [Candidatus Peribacteraceae bacterium]